MRKEEELKKKGGIQIIIRRGEDFYVEQKRDRKKEF